MSTLGAKNIKEVFRSRKPKFVVLFSSISSILGGLGYFAYAAANAYLDRLAEMNASENSTHWITINWDAWALNGSEKESSSGNAISEPEGNEVFGQLDTLVNHHQIIVSTSNLQHRLDKWVCKLLD